MKRIKNIVFVSILTVAGVSSVVGAVGFLQYQYTERNAIRNISGRAEGVRKALVDNFSVDDFADINSTEDMIKPAYGEMQKLLNTIRISAGLRYLYTAKKDVMGNYIYVIDGLEPTANDFAAPGTPIEKELYDYMHTGLRGEFMISDSIMDTEWGPVATAYYPITIPGNKEIPGVLCMEFDMSPVVAALKNSILITIAAGIFCNILALGLVLSLYIRGRKTLNMRIKQTQKHADEADLVLDYMTNCSNDGVMVLSPDEHRSIICNDEFCRILNITDTSGLDLDRFLRILDRLMPPGEYRELNALIKHLDSLPEQKFSREFHLNNPEAKIFLTVRGNFFISNTPSGEQLFIVSIEDLTDQLRVADQNAFERGMFRDALLASAASAVMLDLNSDGVTKQDILKASHDAQVFFPMGDTVNDIDSMLNCFTRETRPMGENKGIRIEASVSSMLGAWERGVRHFTGRYYFPRGNLYFTLLVLFSQNPTNGHVNACFMTHDVAHEKPSRQETNTPETTQTNTNVSANSRPGYCDRGLLERISRDIRSPLNGILGMLGILKNENTSDKAADANTSNDLVEKRNKCYDHMEKSVYSIMAFVGNVLCLDRLRNNCLALEHEPIDIRALLHECVAVIDEQAKRQNITCIINDSEKLTYPVVYGSPAHIRQIIMNLADNALKFNKENGLIIFELTPEDSPDPERLNLNLKIKDTGIGMSEEFLEKIFINKSANAQKNIDINGMGLQVVKGLLDLMHGHLRLVSEPGDGTSAEISISLEGVANGAKTLPPLKNNSLSGMRILLAEDNSLNAEITEFILKSAGAEVETYGNGAAASDAFIDSPKGYFNLAILDIMMPVMDGLEATRTIRNSGHPEAKTIPIIAMTASAMPEDIEACINAGMNEHIAKPIDRRTLITRVASWQNRKAFSKTSSGAKKTGDNVTNGTKSNSPLSGQHRVSLAAPVTWGLPKSSKSDEKNKKA